MTSKLSIIFNYTKYPKELIWYYILFFFIILKSLYLIGQLIYLKKDDFSLRKRLFYIKKSSFYNFY